LKINLLASGGADGQITELLSRVNGGDKVARDALFALAYGN